MIVTLLSILGGLAAIWLLAFLCLVLFALWRLHVETDTPDA